MGDNNVERYEAIGTEVAKLLKLKFKDGRTQTSWGTKSPEGLGRCIERILEKQKEKFKITKP